MDTWWNALSNMNPWLLGALVVWSMVWKALALWHAARGSQVVWYVVLVIINTVGILEIIYLAFFRRKRDQGIRVR